MTFGNGSVPMTWLVRGLWAVLLVAGGFVVRGVMAEQGRQRALNETQQEAIVRLQEQMLGVRDDLKEIKAQNAKILSAVGSR